MKKIVWILFLLGSAVVCIAQPGYPVNLRNVIIGYQTTPEGLFFRGSHSPSHIPLEKYGTFMYVDTVTRQIWMYLDKDTVNNQPVGVWAKMYPSVSDLSSLTDVNTTGKIQNSMLIYDAVTSKWIIDNGTVYRRTSDTLSGQVYGAYNNTKLDSVSALYFDLDTPPVTLSVGMLSWDATTGTASLGLLGGNIQLKVGQQLVKRVVNKTTNNVNLLKSEYKVVKLLGATGSRISVDLAQANSEAGSAGTLGVVIEDINNNQEGFILVAGEITNINTTGTLVGESWNEGDVLYLSATTPGALTKVKPTPPNHTVIVGWVESVNANNGKIYVKIDNGYELEELHNVLTTNKTNGSILYYDNDNGLWKASTGITLDNTGTLALNAVTANTLMYVDADKKLRSVTLTATGSSGAATFSNGTLNIPQYAGSTDLTFTGSSSPVTLNSSTGTDVTLTAGTNIAFSQADNNLTINSTATSSNIYNSNGSIPASTTRTVTLEGNSPGGNTTLLEFKQNTGTGKTTFNGGSILIDKPSNTAATDQSLEVNALSIEGRSVIGGVTEESGIVLAEGAVELRSNAVPIGNAGSPALKVNADNTVSLSTLGTVTSGSGVRLLFREATGVLTDQLVINGSSYPALNRLLPSQTSNANKYLKTNGTDVSWADIVAGVSSVTATPPLFSSGGATPNITIQQANTSQNGFLSSTDWNTFNSKQAALTFTLPLTNTGNTITINQAGTSSNGFLTSADWNTFNNKQNTLTNPVTGTGAANKVAFWSTATELSSNSNFHWNNNNGRLGIGTTSPQNLLHVAGSARIDDVTISKGGDGNGNSIAIGIDALMSNTGPYANIAIGREALKSNTSGYYNVALGIGTLASNVSDANSIAIGINALNKNNGGYFNVAVGSLALENNINGSNLTAFGYQALKANTTGTGNVGLGANALLNNTGGFNNVGIGSEALNNNVSGTYNAGVGGRALFANTGHHNFGLGAFALENKTTGDNNVAIGNYAGQVASNSSAVTNISNSIFIGYATRPSAASGNTNEIVIGTSAIGNGSNTTTIGTSSTTKTVLPGGTLTLSGAPPAIESANNQVLLRNTSTGNVSSLVGNTVNQVLKWDGTKWYAGADEGGGSSSGLTSLNGQIAPSQTFTQGAGMTISSSSSVHTFALADQALAFHNLSTNGIVARTGAGTVAARTITVTSPITVTNGDGVSGNPTIGLSTVPIASGGTGQTTQQAALNALAGGVVTSGQYLRGNGTNVTMSAIQAADIPAQIASNTTGSAATLTTARNIQTNLASTTAASFNGSADVTPGVTGVLPMANGGTGVFSATGYLRGNGSSYSAVNTIPVENGGTGLGIANGNGLVLFNNNTTIANSTYTRQTPSTYTGSSATSVTWDVNYRSSGVYRISNTSTATITGVTVSNVVTGGIYAFHISEASNTVTITVQWPAGTFKDLTDSTDYGTRVYTTPTIITCYYDGANFVCE